MGKEEAGRRDGRRRSCWCWCFCAETMYGGEAFSVVLREAGADGGTEGATEDEQEESIAKLNAVFSKLLVILPGRRRSVIMPPPPPLPSTPPARSHLDDNERGSLILFGGSMMKPGVDGVECRFEGCGRKSGDECEAA
mmetsp:Transcript_34158/g.81435  ORF Transcript_34158/g.81435 Transcript_34158/m.81435 type:complete len:138 (+) Transcript_34158:190-603(+)